MEILKYIFLIVGSLILAVICALVLGFAIGMLFDSSKVVNYAVNATVIGWFFGWIKYALKQ